MPAANEHDRSSLLRSKFPCQSWSSKSWAKQSSRSFMHHGDFKLKRLWNSTHSTPQF